MSDADSLDAASNQVELGPAANQVHAIGNYGSEPFTRVEAPPKAEAKMSGVPPEQWARPVRSK